MPPGRPLRHRGLETPCTGKLYTLVFRINATGAFATCFSTFARWSLDHRRVWFFFFFFFPFPPARFPLACFSSALGLGSLGWVCPSSLLEGEMLSVFSSQVLAETVLPFLQSSRSRYFWGTFLARIVVCDLLWNLS